MQVKIILALALLFSFPAMALNCKAVRWPFSSDVSQIKPKAFEQIQRQYLYNYLFFEISRAPEKRVPGLAKKLFYYLGNSELNDDLRGLVEALEWASDLNLEKPRIISESEICDLVKKTLGSGFEASREPNSTKQKQTRARKAVQTKRK